MASNADNRNLAVETDLTAEGAAAERYIHSLGIKAKEVALLLAEATTGQKNAALGAMAEALLAQEQEILSANAADLARAEAGGMPAAFIDRLTLTHQRLVDMADGLLALAGLPDPVGEEIARWQAAQGIEVVQKRVPIGVVGIIYEARPNVTADAAGICLKTGNAVILRGGSDAIESNLAVAAALRQGIAAVGLPQDAVQVVADTSRTAANVMMRLNSCIDVLIPRGGAGLIQAVLRQASVPVIETGAGVCHIFVEASADAQMAADIVLNAKVQRPAVCNAAETLLIDAAAADRVLPIIAAALQQAGVEIRGCARTGEILAAAGMDCCAAAEADWAAEYGDLVIACRVVDGCADAVAHINRYGTRHSEAIITQDKAAAAFFQSRVDAAAVYVNASTRFTDGFQFGFGAEIGISTQKLHARGPMGLLAMTSYKYLINGEGQTRR